MARNLRVITHLISLLMSDRIGKMVENCLSRLMAAFHLSNSCFGPTCGHFSSWVKGRPHSCSRDKRRAAALDIPFAFSTFRFVARRARHRWRSRRRATHNILSERTACAWRHARRKSNPWLCLHFFHPVYVQDMKPEGFWLRFGRQQGFRVESKASVSV